MKTRTNRRQRSSGRGATRNVKSRFDRFEFVPTAEDGDPTGTPNSADTSDLPPTQLIADNARTIITKNDSPDVPFDRSSNPYKGCEHGCVYCFARPTHAYLGLSPGLDFESRLFYKPDAAALLE